MKKKVVGDLYYRQLKFSNSLLETFNKNEKYNIQLVELEDFDDFYYSEESREFNSAGLFGIHCFATNRTLLRYTNYVSFSMNEDFIDLKNGSFYQKELQKAYNKHSRECFIFIIFCINPEWNSLEKLQKEHAFLKSIWPYSLYLSD